MAALAPFLAHLNLILQIGLGLALLAGARLARRSRFRAHGIRQTIAVLVNLLLIALVMAPSFHRQVLPNLARASDDAYYGVAVAHALVGSAAVLLAVYVIFVAGTTLVPERLRFRDYRTWMRATLGLWWIAMLLGIVVYVVWYTQAMPVSPTAAAPTAPDSPRDAAVAVRNFSFGPDALTITTGTRVIWTDAGGRHSIESDDGSIKSPTLVAGQRFEHTFDRPGAYEYFCGIHGRSVMRGRIVVSQR